MGRELKLRHIIIAETRCWVLTDVEALSAEIEDDRLTLQVRPWRSLPRCSCCHVLSKHFDHSSGTYIADKRWRSEAQLGRVRREASIVS